MQRGEKLVVVVVVVVVERLKIALPPLVFASPSLLSAKRGEEERIRPGYISNGEKQQLRVEFHQAVDGSATDTSLFVQYPVTLQPSLLPCCYNDRFKSIFTTRKCVTW